MNEQISIPVRPLPAGGIGAGSQPSASDGVELTYLAMPSEMQTYRQPVLPEPDEVAGLAPGLALLNSLRHILCGYRAGAMPLVIGLAGLDADNRRLVIDSLGEGEVSVVCTGTREQRAQETRLAGIWRVRSTDGDGQVIRDVLEIADVPGFVRESAFAGSAIWADLAEAAPVGVMNAPGVLAELNEQVERRQRGEMGETYILNLTLLPQSEQDLDYLAGRLGAGAVSILSRGYGNCRITATGLADVWWVQFYNSDDRLILNTLEVTDVPAAALAAQEDIDDSAIRLGEILEALQ